jgi:hypothetical protein
LQRRPQLRQPQRRAWARYLRARLPTLRKSGRDRAPRMRRPLASDLALSGSPAGRILSGARLASPWRRPAIPIDICGLRKRSVAALFAPAQTRWAMSPACRGPSPSCSATLPHAPAWQPNTGMKPLIRRCRTRYASAGQGRAAVSLCRR